MKGLRKQLAVVFLSCLFCLPVSGLKANEQQNGATASSSNSLGQVVFSQLIHRHGARTPLVKGPTAAEACGDIGCGQLTPEGKDMLHQLGLWTRNRYMMNDNGDSSIDISTQYLQNSSYFDPMTIYQRSTSHARTLQSSDAFLQGLFNFSNSSGYPTVASRSLEDDTLLVVEALPGYEIPATLFKKERLSTFALEDVLQMQPNRTAWVVMGEELYLEPYCADAETSLSALGECALKVDGSAQSYRSSGTLNPQKYPVTYSFFRDPDYHKDDGNLLGAILEKWHAREFQVNHTTPSSGGVNPSAAVGPLGLNVLKAMLNNISYFLEGNEVQGFSSGSHVLIEYSAHDTTLMPMAAALGQPGQMRPPYATAYFFELILNKTRERSTHSGDGADSSSSSSPSCADRVTSGNTTLLPSDPSCYDIRIIWGSPIQGYGHGPHLYNNMTYFSLTCLDSNSSSSKPAPPYTPKDLSLGCPLEHFAAYIKAVDEDRSPEGYCYLDQEVLTLINCTDSAKDSTTPAVVGSPCYSYRKSCPGVACGESKFLTFPNLTCIDPFPCEN